MISPRAMTNSANLNVMIDAAQKAGRALIRDFGEIEQLQVSKKSLGDFVSTADHRAEKIIFQELQKARPSYSFLMEESGDVKGQDKDHVWIVDPLDGTSNFLHGIPYFSISIALQKMGEIIAGVIFNPISDELFWAEKGAGAFMNKRRLRVSGRVHLDEAMVACGTPFGKRGNSEQYLTAFKTIVPQISGVRRFGSVALDLCYVAAGRIEGCFEMNLSSWDLAAGALIVKEAGGYVCDFKGEQDFLKTGNIIAGNSSLFPEFQRIIVGKD